MSEIQNVGMTTSIKAQTQALKPKRPSVHQKLTDKISDQPELSRPAQEAKSMRLNEVDVRQENEATLATRGRFGSSKSVRGKA